MAVEGTRELGARILLTITVILVVIAPVIARVAVTRGQAEAELGGPWTTHIRQIDRALGEKDLTGAVRAWHEAYAAAMGHPRWEGLLEVGDASLRIGEAPTVATTFVGKARRAYLAGLFRARDQGSLEGVLRAADAFAALGDREVVQRSLRMAEAVAAHGADRYAMDHLRAASERLMSRLAPAEPQP
jgi:hypothetical protein